MTFKKCTRCVLDKPLDQFHRKPNGSIGADGVRRHTQCGTCRNADLVKWRSANPEKTSVHSRRVDLKRRYGITPVIYDLMSIAQDGKCIVTGEPPREGTSLCVDHSHVGGHVRGLLSFAANVALGMLGEDAGNFAAALMYLAADDEVLSPDDFRSFIRAYPVRPTKRYTLHRKEPSNGRAPNSRPGERRPSR